MRTLNPLEHPIVSGSNANWTLPPESVPEKNAFNIIGGYVNYYVNNSLGIDLTGNTSQNNAILGVSIIMPICLTVLLF